MRHTTGELQLPTATYYMCCRSSQNPPIPIPMCVVYLMLQQTQSGCFCFHVVNAHMREYTYVQKHMTLAGVHTTAGCLIDSTFHPLPSHDSGTNSTHLTAGLEPLNVNELVTISGHVPRIRSAASLIS